MSTIVLVGFCLVFQKSSCLFWFFFMIKLPLIVACIPENWMLHFVVITNSWICAVCPATSNFSAVTHYLSGMAIANSFKLATLQIEPRTPLQLPRLMWLTYFSFSKHNTVTDPVLLTLSRSWYFYSSWFTVL